jgi:chemotaxis protein methyltransferase CheR
VSDFAYSERDFTRIRRLIHERAGIALAEAKRDMAYSRLTRLLRAGGHRRMADYLDGLERKGSDDDWQDFVNALTTNLTSFFREAHHFEMLAEHLRRPGAPAKQRIWCAAASTGEEVWSLAIAACEAFDRIDPPVEIIGSDIDTACLQKAAAGVYALARIEDVSGARRKRFFQRGIDGNAGLARMRPELYKLVRVYRCNLLDARWPVQGPFDAIFCRNVMIYFDKPTQHRVLRQMAPLLRDDGLLFAGHSESFFHAADVVTSRGRTVYAPVRGAMGNAA